MSAAATIARTGFRRGLIELRHTFTNIQDIWTYLFPSILFLVIMTFMRGSKVPGTDFSLGSMTLPSVLGTGIAFGGLLTLSQLLTVEREDGTLLRSKAIPHGMGGYLVGKIVLTSGMMLIGFLLTLIPGLFLFTGLDVQASSWLTLIWVVLLGLIATLPIGAIIGSLISDPRSMGLITLPIMGLVAASGIFYPITHLPSWLQVIGQIFPIYWLGLGMRSALLPDSLSAVEIGQSWRHLETFGVLGAWAVVGLLVAPIVLRRMARRESGSTVAARREKALQRTPR
jgi:ABC-2 type transport system permease protein